MMEENDFEQLGLMVDRMDNLSAASVLRLPNEMRISILNEAIRDMRDELRALLIGAGFNPWSA